MLHSQFKFMLKECKQQETGPAQQQTKVLKQKREARSGGLYSIHLWKLEKGKNGLVTYVTSDYTEF